MAASSKDDNLSDWELSTEEFFASMLLNPEGHALNMTASLVRMMSNMANSKSKPYITAAEVAALIEVQRSSRFREQQSKYDAALAAHEAFPHSKPGYKGRKNANPPKKPDPRVILLDVDNTARQRNEKPAGGSTRNTSTSQNIQGFQATVAPVPRQHIGLNPTLDRNVTWEGNATYGIPFGKPGPSLGSSQRFQPSEHRPSWPDEGTREVPASLGRRIAPRPTEPETSAPSLNPVTRGMHTMSIQSTAHGREAHPHVGSNLGQTYQSTRSENVPRPTAQRYREPSNPPSRQRDERSSSQEERFDGRWSPLPEEFRYDTAPRLPRRQRTPSEERLRRARSPSPQENHHYGAGQHRNPAQTSRTKSAASAADRAVNLDYFELAAPPPPRLGGSGVGHSEKRQMSTSSSSSDPSGSVAATVNLDYFDLGAKHPPQQQTASRRHGEKGSGGSRKAGGQTRKERKLDEDSGHKR